MIIDAHAHIVVRAAAAGPGRSGSWRPQVTEAGGRSRIHHDGRELTSVIREFTDPDRMAAGPRRRESGTCCSPRGSGCCHSSIRCLTPG